MYAIVTTSPAEPAAACTPVNKVGCPVKRVDDPDRRIGELVLGAGSGALLANEAVCAAISA